MSGLRKRMIRRGHVTLPHSTLMTETKKRILKLSRPQFGGVDLDDLVEEQGLGIGLPVATLYCIGIVCTFLCLLWTIATQSQSESFLAVSKPAGVDCTEVPLTLTQTFEGTYTGFWETSSQFDGSESIFILEMPGVRLKNSEYVERMGIIKSKLSYIGQKLASRSLLFQYIAYSVYTVTDRQTWTNIGEQSTVSKGRKKLLTELADDTPMEFSSSADASISFRESVGVSTLSTRDGVCLGPADGSKFISGRFDIGTNALVLSLPFHISPELMHWTSMNNVNKTFRSQLNKMSVPCSMQLRHRHLAALTYKAEFRDQKIEFGFDIHTAILALALNMDSPTRPMVDLETLNQVSSQANLGLIGYVDNTYEMDPVWCIDKQDKRWELSGAQEAGPNICFVPLKKNSPTFDLYYPVLGQAYPDMSQCTDKLVCKRVTCSCPRDRDVPLCSKPNWFFGFIYGNDPVTDDQFDDDYAPSNQDQLLPSPDLVKLSKKMQQFMVDDPENGDKEMVEFIAPVLYSTFYSSNNFAEADTRVNLSWTGNQSFNGMLRKAWDDTCSTCGALVFQFYSGEPRGWVMNSAGVSMQDLVVAGEDQGNITDDTPSGGNRANFSLTMCRNTLSQQNALDKLMLHPPVPLVQSYFQCRRTFTNALYSSLGSAVAAANFYVTSAWIVIGFIVMRFMRMKMGNRLVGRHAKDNIREAHEDLQAGAVVAFAKSALKTIEGLNSNKESAGNAVELLSHLRESVAQLELTFAPSSPSVERALGVEVSKMLRAQQQQQVKNVLVTHANQDSTSDEPPTTENPINPHGTSSVIDVIPHNPDALKRVNGKIETTLEIERL